MGCIEQSIAANLRAHRAVARLSQQEVANRIGVSRATVRAWEDGKNLASVGSLVALADMYGVRVDDLIGRERKTA